MQLKSLINSAGFSLSVDSPDIEIKGITSDSRRVKQGFIFVAVKGGDFDGHSFVREALLRGAAAVIIQDTGPRIPETAERAFIKVADSRQALARLAAQFYGQPSLGLKVIGITGTNGKTTVSYLIEAILKSAGFTPAVIGTINYRYKGKIFNAVNTTPDPEELQALLAQMREEGVDYVIIEVSSHALDQARVESVRFLSAIFTNFSVDHLDYHRDLNSYFNAKGKLFAGLLKDNFAILNIDDSRAYELIKLTQAHVVKYGLSSFADIFAEDLNYSFQGTEFFLRLGSEMNKNLTLNCDRIKLSTALIGKHNIYNILAAVAFGLTQGIDLKIIRQAIREFPGVPGRLERIPVESDFSVFVDYAHTQDALKNVITSLRPLCKGRLYVVFGCGGNRDKAKRPMMGRVVSELADLAIITTDNPRNEQPQEIINEIITGINKQNFKVILDRQAAIKETLSQAGKDDIILVAGKGHENYQIFKNKRTHFDDREVVRECLS